MNQITDIHMHIIPHVDDGSGSLEESVIMLRSSASQGVGTVIATPHSWAIDECGCEHVLSQFDALKRAVSEYGIPIRLYLGCEMLIFPDTADECIRKLNAERYPAMAGSRHVLTEFLPDFSRRDMEFCVEKIASAGYVPIVAHAERYEHTTVDGVRMIRNLGALIQINAYSIVNEPKAQTRNTANRLLSEKLVDFIGSDTHRLNHRPPVIRDGIDALAALYSEEYAELVSVKNPHDLLLKQWNNAL